MKIKCCALLTVLFCFLYSSAQDVIRISINNKTTKYWPITNRPLIFQLHKSDYKNISKITLEYKQQAAVTVYKRSIEITNEKEDQLLLADEAPAKKEKYILNLVSARKLLLQQKMIKIFFVENPANERMSLPSRRKLIAELHLK